MKTKHLATLCTTRPDKQRTKKEADVTISIRSARHQQRQTTPRRQFHMKRSTAGIYLSWRGEHWPFRQVTPNVILVAQINSYMEACMYWYCGAILFSSTRISSLALNVWHVIYTCVQEAFKRGFFLPLKLGRQSKIRQKCQSMVKFAKKTIGKKIPRFNTSAKGVWVTCQNQRPSLLWNIQPSKTNVMKCWVFGQPSLYRKCGTVNAIRPQTNHRELQKNKISRKTERKRGEEKRGENGNIASICVHFVDTASDQTHEKHVKHTKH